MRTLKKMQIGKYVIWAVLTAMGAMNFACSKSESPVEVISKDTAKPDKVSGVSVENLYGAARITYTLPKSTNILYVQAKYLIREDHYRESKTSFYTDTILVDGFAQAGEYEVELRTVSRANITSDPVIVKVEPLTPNYIRVNEGLEISPDFGGANFLGRNPDASPIAIHVLAYDVQTNKFKENDPEYINGEVVDVSIRGFQSEENEFGVYTTDRFGNASPVRYTKLTPLFERELDKRNFFVYNLPSDAPIGYGWDLKYLFDGSLNDPGWHTNGAPSTVATFGIGPSAKISRFVLWNRLPNMYSDQNPKSMTIWGSNEDSPSDAVLPRTYQPGDVVGDWVNMGNFNYPDPPSGLPGSQANASDNDFEALGVNFRMPSAAPAVKYIR
ncbi:MAG: DUF4959 domain-containing protein, partial [Sphingobacterium sp.]